MSRVTLQGVVLVLAAVVLVCAGSPLRAQSAPPVGVPSARLDSLLLQLADTSDQVRVQARGEFRRLGEGSVAAVPGLLTMLDNQTAIVRIFASRVLADMATAGYLPESAVPRLLVALEDSDSFVRNVAATALIRAKSADPLVMNELTQLIGDPDIGSNITRELMNLRPHEVAAAVPYLRESLRHPLGNVRINAAMVLGSLGALSRPAVGDLASLVSDPDTVLAGIAAEAVGRIIPRHDVRMVPMRAMIFGDGNALKPDNRGAYVHGVDSTAVNSCAAINIALLVTGDPGCGDPEYRATSMQNLNGVGRRYMTLDLNHPVPGSGAVAKGIITDEQAQIHAFWKHTPFVAIFFPPTIPTDQEGVFSERVEFGFRIDGVLHLLQFGPWVRGEFNPQFQPGQIHGEGTTQARIFRPNEKQFRFTAPEGSIGRLWNVADPSRSVDLGLYYFSFDVLWEMLGNR